MRTSITVLFILLVSTHSLAQSFSQPDFLSSTPFELRTLTVADFDNDGDQDAVIGGIGVNQSGIEYWKNQGVNFELIEGAIPFANFGSFNLASADINMDGHMDLVGVVEGMLGWVPNDGTGAFLSPIQIDSELDDVRSIEFGELNGVAGPDILISRINNDAIWAYPSDGNNGYGEPVIVSSSTTDAIDAKIADLDGDGLNDIVAACLNGCDVTWHKNLGSMNFGIQTILTQDQIGTYKLALGDFNDDELVDIASVGFGSDDLSVFFNEGEGEFGPRQIVSENVDGASNLAVGDFNNDGNLDLCVGSENLAAPTLFEGDGTGDFIEISLDQLGTVSNPEVYIGADVNGDGRDDLVTASQGDNKLSVFLQKDDFSGSGTIPLVPPLIVNKPASGVNGLLAFDVDLDGFNDIVSSDPGASRITWYRQNETGPESQLTLFEVSTGVSGIAQGPLNNDPWPDLVISNIPDSTITIYFREGPEISFQSFVLDVGLSQPYRPEVVDLDDDGDLDILLAEGWEANIHIYPNNGDGTFDDRITLCNDCSLSRALAAEDLNTDGLPEIVAYIGQNQQIDFFENLGNMSFGPRQVLIDGFNGARDIEFFDFDEDGDIDVFAAAIFDDRVNYAENLGGLQFAPEAEVPYNFWGPYDLEVIDADADGDEDLAMAEFFANKLRIIEIENGQFIGRSTIDNPYQNPNSILAGDFNNDGAVDLTAGFLNHVAFYENEAFTCSGLIPENLQAEVGENAVELTWNPLPQTEACRITIQGTVVGSPVFNQDIFGLGLSSFTIPLSAFEEGSGYIWKVQCACSVTPLETTASSSFDYFDIPVMISVYPNPASNEIVINTTELKSIGAEPFAIIDIRGRVIKQGIFSGRIDISDIEPGSYVLKLAEDRIKFLKQ